MESRIKLPPETQIHGYRLVRTCEACPEQYDVYDMFGTMTAYLRLRHGSFTATVPDVGGDVVYASNPKGDGIFEPDERLRELTKAIEAVQAYLLKSNLDDYSLTGYNNIFQRQTMRDKQV